MDNNYFESLANSVQEPAQPKSNSSNISGQAFLTIKVDIDCKLYCDGDFLDLFEANKVKKITVPTGWHLFTIESEQFDDVTEDHEMDVAESGKNYPLLVKGLKEKMQTHIQKQEKEKKQQEAEAEKKRQEEDNLKLAQEASKNDIVFKIDISIPSDKIHEKLVYLFSGALTGSDMLSCDFDTDFWEEIPEDRKQTQWDIPCFEDKIADILLNGGNIYVYDLYAEGELHGEKGEIITVDIFGHEAGEAKYTINLSDIIKGLQNAANGTFKHDEAWERADARESFLNFIDEGEYNNFDSNNGEDLVQIILFNEIIYC